MMIPCILVRSAFGAILALFWLFYFIRNEDAWKWSISNFIGLGTDVGALFVIDKYLPVDDVKIRMYSSACLLIAFIITLFVGLYVTSIIIKDHDDTNILRIRDIMLGQKGWITNYYKLRERQIDESLNIETLEKREKNVSQAERDIKNKEEYLNQEQNKLLQESKKRTKMHLPENAPILLTQRYVDAIPSYLKDVCTCANSINQYTKLFLSHGDDEITYETLKSYFISIATCISNDIFGGNTKEVRVHFRLYDKETDSYERFVVVTGGALSNNPMTAIPYGEDSMIKKSYECKRPLIKSINGKYDYVSKPHTLWTDYMTYTFQNLHYKNKPCLSFGISIRNDARYKDILHFLNYCELEYWLQDNIEKMNERIDIAKVLYKEVQ